MKYCFNTILKQYFKKSTSFKKKKKKNRFKLHEKGEDFISVIDSKKNPHFISYTCSRHGLLNPEIFLFILDLTFPFLDLETLKRMTEIYK